MLKECVGAFNMFKMKKFHSLERSGWNLDAYCKMDPFGAERQANKSKCGFITLNDDDRDDDSNNTASFVHTND